MKKKILVIFTGGTICTTVKNGVMSTGTAAPMALIEFFRKENPQLSGLVQIDTGKNLGILSENMTVDKWNEIAGYFAENIEKFQSYDGVVIAHGTDTLAYTTSLFSVLLKGFLVPMIFVSSNRPIMLENGNKNPDANGVDNFTAAVDCICKGIGCGVYATYKNPKDSRMYLHNGGHLIQCSIYDDNFYSRDAIDISNGLTAGHLSLFEKCDTNDLLIMRIKEKKLKDCILKVTPYVGLNYDMFNLAGVRVVLHGTYHSGTACTVKTAECPDYTENKGSISLFYKYSP